MIFTLHLGGLGLSGSPGAEVELVIDEITKTVRDVTSGADAVSMPAIVNAGDLLIAQIAYIGSNAVAPSPSGWNLVADTLQADANSFWYYKIADGSEGGTTVNFDFTNTSRFVALVFVIAAGEFSSNVPVEAISKAGSGVNPDPPRIRAGDADSTKLFIASFASREDSRVDFYPAGTVFQDEVFNTIASGICSGFSYLLSNANDIDPGLYTTQVANTWVATTLVVYPAGYVDDGPAVISVTETAFISDSTDHLVSMPSAVNSGDRLIILFSNDGSAAVTAPSGWTQIDSAASGSAVRLSAYYKDADGSEGGTTVNFVTAAIEQAAAHVLRLDAGTFDSGQAPAISSATSSALATITPPELTAGWSDDIPTLWICAVGHDDNDVLEGFPVNYRKNRTRTTSTAGFGESTLISATRFMKNNNDQPGLLRLEIAEEYVAFTIAVKGN